MSELPPPDLGKNVAPRMGRHAPPVLLFNPLRTGLMENLHPISKCLSIVAPVGYGKTVLMATLFSDQQQAGNQCIWLALDDQDLSLEGIVSELVMLIHGGNKQNLLPTQPLFRGSDPVNGSVDLLMRLLNTQPLPITIFIDNLHFCPDPRLGRLLDQLLFQTSESVRLVFSSSHEMSFDVARGQLEGLVTQIGPAELSFDNADIADLLGEEIADKLGTQGILEVTRKTEGWPAAARMIKILLDRSEQPHKTLDAFSGSDTSLAQLLNREVLYSFPSFIRDFLLCLAQLRTFSEELCVEAIGGEFIHENLRYLIEHNVFIIPLDHDRKWFRLHGLFREHLLREAERELDADRRQYILTRAASWCERHELWRESMEYAFASGSTSMAIRALNRIASSFVRDHGAIQQYVRWLEVLHGHGRQAGAEAEYWFAWALTFQRRYDYAYKNITRLSSRLQRRKPQPSVAELQRRIAMLRASLDSFADRLEDSYVGAVQWLAEAGDTENDAFNLAAAYCIMCWYLINDLRLTEARHAAISAQENASQVSSTLTQSWVSCYTALIAISEGSYAEGYAAIVRALALTRTELGDDAGIYGTMALLAARCAVGMGLDAEAKQLFELGVKSARSHGFLDAVGCGIEAGLMLWTGQGDDSVPLSTLQEVAAAYPQRLSLTFSCYKIRRLIVLGYQNEAMAEAERMGLNSSASNRSGQLQKILKSNPQFDLLVNTVKIELHIAAGRYKQALSLLATQLSRAKTSGCNARLVELELNSAAIAVRIQDYILGARHVTRAVRIATPKRIVRPFIDHKNILSLLINQTRAATWGFATRDARQFFSEICRYLGTGDQQAMTTETSSEVPSRSLDTLTPRETELLSLIGEGLSNQQIADHLDISLPTVKWHLQNLYQKLGVSRRTAALVKARHMNLLD